MPPHNMSIFMTPQFTAPPRLIIGFSGWMDGGDVSTGTVDYFVSEYQMEQFALIYPDSFYINHIPGSLELVSMLRPFASIADGVIRTYNEIENQFFFSEEHNLIVLRGNEPHINWRLYCDCVFELAQQTGVETIYFAGSYAGMVPHTREPRVTAVISNDQLRDLLSRCNIKFANYQGPSSLITYMIRQAESRNIKMASIVAEIPPYIQGRNPRCIESVLRRFCRLLDLDLDLAELRMISDEIEKRLNTAVAEREDLTEHIARMEETYDKDVFDTDMPDLKQWLIDKGIRLD